MSKENNNLLNPTSRSKISKGFLKSYKNVHHFIPICFYFKT